MRTLGSSWGVVSIPCAWRRNGVRRGQRRRRRGDGPSRCTGRPPWESCWWLAWEHGRCGGRARRRLDRWRRLPVPRSRPRSEPSSNRGRRLIFPHPKAEPSRYPSGRNPSRPSRPRERAPPLRSRRRSKGRSKERRTRSLRGVASRSRFLAALEPIRPRRACPLPASEPIRRRGCLRRQESAPERPSSGFRSRSSSCPSPCFSPRHLPRIRRRRRPNLRPRRGLGPVPTLRRPLPPRQPLASSRQREEWLRRRSPSTRPARGGGSWKCWLSTRARSRPSTARA